MSPIPLGPFAFSLLLVGAFAAVRLHRVVQRSKRRQRLVRLLPTIALYTQGELGAYDVSGQLELEGNSVNIWTANATGLLGCSLLHPSALDESSDEQDSDYWNSLEVRPARPTEVQQPEDLRHIAANGSIFEVLTHGVDVTEARLDDVVRAITSPLAELVPTLDSTKAKILLWPASLHIDGVTATDDAVGKRNVETALTAAARLLQALVQLRSIWPHN